VERHLHPAYWPLVSRASSETTILDESAMFPLVQPRSICLAQTSDAGLSCVRGMVFFDLKAWLMHIGLAQHRDRLPEIAPFGTGFVPPSS
jgi:hypothetical protein